MRDPRAARVRRVEHGHLPHIARRHIHVLQKSRSLVRDLRAAQQARSGESRKGVEPTLACPALAPSTLRRRFGQYRKTVRTRGDPCNSPKRVANVKPDRWKVKHVGVLLICREIGKSR